MGILYAILSIIAFFAALSAFIAWIDRGTMKELGIGPFAEQNEDVTQSKKSMILTEVTYKFKDQHGSEFTVLYQVKLQQWTVSQNGKQFYTTPTFYGMPITDDSALKILRRALKLD